MSLRDQAVQTRPQCTHQVVGGLFRAFPYDEVAGHKIGDEEIYAAKPDWNAAPASQPQA